MFHLAAQVTIRGSFERFYEDLDTNVMGTARLRCALDPAAIKWFVLASSMAVYGDAPRPRRSTRRIPPLLPSPLDGKLAAEGVANRLWPPGGFFSAMRYFNTFGPGQIYTPYVGVITIFVNRLLGGDAPVVFGDGEQQRLRPRRGASSPGRWLRRIARPESTTSHWPGHIAQRAGVTRPRG